MFLIKSVCKTEWDQHIMYDLCVIFYNWLSEIPLPLYKFSRYIWIQRAGKRLELKGGCVHSVKYVSNQTARGGMHLTIRWRKLHKFIIASYSYINRGAVRLLWFTRASYSLQYINSMRIWTNNIVYRIVKCSEPRAAWCDRSVTVCACSGGRVWRGLVPRTRRGLRLFHAGGVAHHHIDRARAQPTQATCKSELNNPPGWQRAHHIAARLFG